MTASIPIGFVAFCDTVLHITLTPGQRVLALVAFDGVDPCQLDGADRDIARELFGDIDTVPPGARAVLAAMCGARGGKSYVLVALRLLHLALTVPLTSLAPGEAAAAIVVAPDARLSRAALRYIAGAIRGVHDIERCVVAESADAIMLQRPDGGMVELLALPATRGGSAVRGRSLVGAGMDEACFMRDDQAVVNDVELFKALAPRIMPGGQLIICSTPWTEAGLLFDLVARNHGTPVDALAVRAATTVLRDDPSTHAMVARERERDPDNASREFDAVPLGAGASEFFDAATLKACEVADAPAVDIRPGAAIIALDTGFRRDPCAAIVVREHADGFHVAECIEHKPEPGKRLVPSQVLSSIAARAAEHGCTSAVADQHYIESTKEHFSGLEVVEAPAGAEGKAEIFIAARTAMREGRVHIPAVHARLLAQLRQVAARPTPGGGLSITQPRRGGAHGDLASAAVLGIWRFEATSRINRAITNYRGSAALMTPSRALRVDLGLARPPERDNSQTRSAREHLESIAAHHCYPANRARFVSRAMRQSHRLAGKHGLSGF